MIRYRCEQGHEFEAEDPVGLCLCFVEVENLIMPDQPMAMMCGARVEMTSCEEEDRMLALHADVVQRQLPGRRLDCEYTTWIEGADQDIVVSLAGRRL